MANKDDDDLYAPITDEERESFGSDDDDLYAPISDAEKKAWDDEYARNEGELLKHAEKHYEKRKENEGRYFSNFLRSADAAMQEFKPFTGLSDRALAAAEAGLDKTGFRDEDGLEDQSFGDRYDARFKEIRGERKQSIGKSKAGAAVGALTGLASNIVIPAGGIGFSTASGAVDMGTRGDKISGKDAAMGGLLGFGFGALPGVVKTFGEHGSDAWKAFKSGETRVAGISDAVDTFFSRYKNSKEIKSFVRDAQKRSLSRINEESPDEAKRLRDAYDKMSDEEFVILELEKQNPEVVEFVTTKAASLNPNHANKNQYENILAKGVERRNEARNFNKKAAAGELAPLIDKGSEAFDSTIREGVGRNTAKAQQSFDLGLDEFESVLDDAIADSASMDIISSKVAKRIGTARKMFTDGQAKKSYGLTKNLKWAKADGKERYNRLQKMREVLDKGIDYDAINSGRRKMDEGEEILAELRDAIDQQLKSVDGKAAADELSRAGFKYNDELFGKTELKQGVDRFKVGRLLNDTDDGGRFRDSLEDFKDWTKNAEIMPDNQRDVDAMIGGLEKTLRVSDDARDIANFKFQTPTGSAVDGLRSAIKGQNRLQDLILNPHNAVANLDSFIANEVPSLTGKNWGALSASEKEAAIKVYAAAKGEMNRGIILTPEKIAAYYTRFLSGSKERKD